MRIDVPLSLHVLARGRVLAKGVIIIIALAVAGCSSGAEEPSATPIPATMTSAPPATSRPPSATPPLPTETPLPPTETPLPPSATPVPPTPTETPEPTATPIPEPTATLDPTVFELRSPAFAMDGRIPVVHTCNGEDISPPLEWGAPPEGTQSLVLLMDDISAGNLVHWVLFNLPPETRSLPERLPKRGSLSDGTQQGINNALKTGYFGPCPLPGPNRYRFRLFAVDTMLDLEDRVMAIPVKQAMRDHILAETELIGEFGR